MASWVTHLMIADQVLLRFPALERRGFCVGSIAPDCNVENEDWTAFTPPREVTHWMQGERKKAGDCELFYQEYLVRRAGEVASPEHYAFLLGYYAHLVADAEYQRMIRDEARVRAVWRRIHAAESLHTQAAGVPETWDSVKMLIPGRERMREISAMEAEYLAEHPDSGYITEILPLQEFPDYIGYLPPGCIVRKIGIMGVIPQLPEAPAEPIAVSRAEYAGFAARTVALITEEFRKKQIYP